MRFASCSNYFIRSFFRVLKNNAIFKKITFDLICPKMTSSDPKLHFLQYLKNLNTRFEKWRDSKINHFFRRGGDPVWNFLRHKVSGWSIPIFTIGIFHFRLLKILKRVNHRELSFVFFLCLKISGAFQVFSVLKICPSKSDFFIKIRLIPSCTEMYIFYL